MSGPPPKKELAPPPPPPPGRREPSPDLGMPVDLHNKKRQEPLAMSMPMNMAGERVAYPSLPAEPVRAAAASGGGGLGNAVLSGVIAGMMASVTIVAMHFLGPSGSSPAPAAPAPAEPVVAATPLPVEKKVEAPAPDKAPAPAPVAAAPAPSAAPDKADKPDKGSKKDGKKPSVSDAFAKVAAAPGGADELTMAEVTEVVKSHKAQVDACAEAQRTAAPDTPGRQVMRITVDTEGKVTAVSPNSGNAFSECLAKEIHGWSFPKHALAGPVEVPFKY